MNTQQLQRHFLTTLKDQGLIRPGERVLVALSGGADSMALLHLCLEAAEELRLEVAAAHFDHSLRAESREDAAFVAHHCQTYGVKLRSERCDVARCAAEQGVGLEEAARELRYDFLRRSAESLGCQCVVLGHHCQDQAETVLHRLIRGTGMAGLAAMRPRRDLFVRPLLDVNRDALQRFLGSRQIAFREDASNQDEAFTRNYLRHTVMPLLRRVNPGVDVCLANLAQGAALEEEFWQAHLERLAESLRHPEGGWSVEALLCLHPAERRRMLVGLLREAAGEQIAYAHVVAVDVMLRSDQPQAETCLPGMRAVRRYDRFEFLPAGGDVAQHWQVEIHRAGRYVLPCGVEMIVAEGDGCGTESCWSVSFPRASVDYPLIVRPFRPGDRIALGDDAGRKKLKKLFGELRLEKEVRAILPLLLMGGEVLWVPGVRRTGKYRQGSGVGEELRITLEKPESIESLLVKSGCLC